MRFENEFEVALARPALWDILMDVHQVAECLAGVEELEVIEADRYEGLLAVTMGPVRLRFRGDVSVTLRDRDQWTGVLEASAKDAKAGGGFRAALTMKLAEQDAGKTALQLDLDATLFGKIGELGRPMIKKKINTMMSDFVTSLETRHAVPVGADP